MKINLYIVTYKNHIGLHECLESLQETILPNNVVLTIHIINNHSDFQLDKKFNNITVLHNTLRPDFSTGHLSRNWNQAIIHGFKNLLKPSTDIVITCQVDTIFNRNWLLKLIELHKNYNFITAGWGDAFMSFTPDAIRNIGLFDERFCNIIHQECDFFTRAVHFNKDKSSINDFHHGKILNPFLDSINDNSFIYRKNSNTKDTWNSTVECHKYITKFLLSKYSENPIIKWDIHNPPKLIKKLIMFYPYFEFDILDVFSKYESY